MQIKNMLALLVVGAVVALMATSVSFAGEEAAPAKPVEKKAEAKVEGESPCCSECEGCDCKEAKAAFDNPMMVMMVWAAKKIVPEGTSMCPSTDEGEKAWRNWFDGGKDVPLAELRDHMVKMGWNADKTIGWFQAKAKGKTGECGSCAKGAAAATPAAKAVGGAQGVAGDAGPSGKAKDCAGCDGAKDCAGCDKGEKKCCGGCDKEKKEMPTKIG